MSAPEVGDRVRVIAGPTWLGHEGDVTFVWHVVGRRWVEVDFDGRPRTLPAEHVEVVSTTRTQPPQRPEEGSGAPVEAQAANGAHRGGKR